MTMLRVKRVRESAGRAVLLLAAFLVAFSAATAQEPPTEAPADTVALADSTPPSGAPVLLGGREVFRIPVGIKAWSAEERARSVSERILQVAKDRLAPVDSIRIDDMDISTDGVLGDRVLFSFYDADAAAANRERIALAEEAAVAVRAAIEEYRVGTSPKNLAIGIAWTLVATAALWVVLVVLARRFRTTSGAIDRWIEAKQDRIREKSKSILAPEVVQTLLKGLARLLRLLLVLAAVYVYLQIVLSLFPRTRRLAASLLGYVIQPLRTIAASTLDNLPGLIFIAVLGLVTYYVLKLARFVFDEIAAERITFTGFYPEWAKPTFNIFRVFAVAFAVVVAYPYIPGSDTGAFKGVSLFLGVLFSLGSTSAVANIVAGIILTYMRAFRVGDFVEIGSERGVLTETTLLATHLRTAKNVEITIPNATVLGSHVTNFTTHIRDRKLILHTMVGIGYNVPWRQVHAMLLTAASQTKGLLQEPAPFVLQRALEDSCVRYELNAYTDRAEGMLGVYSDLHKRVLDIFNEYGVQIMTPSYEGDRETPAIVPKSDWYAAPARQPGEPGADA
jgi:small-conductance mechanosensitive channel